MAVVRKWARVGHRGGHEKDSERAEVYAPFRDKAQSWRKATTGSSRLARRAGPKAAQVATTESMAAVASSVSGSPAVYAKKEARQQAAARRRGHEADSGADRGQDEPFAENQAGDVPRPRAQRDPDADLARALPRGLRHHAVETDGGQGEGKDGEEGEENHGRAPPRHPPAQHVVHRAYREHG